MKRHLPGTKPSLFGNLSLSDHLPDPRYPAIPDMRRRNVFSSGSMVNALAAVAVSTTTTTYTTEPLRVRSAQVGTVAGGTITVQVQADGRDLFDDTQRPVSGAAPKEATDLYIIPAGTPITAIVEADSGIPTGTANVVLETEPYTLLPQLETVELHGKKRLRLSERRAAAAANAGTNLVKRDLTGTASGSSRSVAEGEQRANQTVPGARVVGERLPGVPGGPFGGGGGGPNF